MDEDENGGLFNIQPDSENEEEVKKREDKVPRDFQSEEDFQSQRRDFRPKVEIGDLYKTLDLPIDNPTKPQSQTILHAIEELYFYRRYEMALRVTEDALKGDVVDEFRKTLLDYKVRCEAKLKSRDVIVTNSRNGKSLS